MHSSTIEPHAVSNRPPSPEDLERILKALTAILAGPGILNAELWQDNEAPHERPGRLELPRTQTVFLRIERTMS